jgi:hypothetical protein
MVKLTRIIISILSKLRIVNSEEELDLEAFTVWIFLGITAFRALFAGATITLGHDFKFTVQDINLASTLPILYATLSNSHRRYLDSKTNNTKGDSSGQ